MLRQIRGGRVSLKTFIIVVGLALLAWAIVVYVQVRDFVPDEFDAPSETSGEVVP